MKIGFIEQVPDDMNLELEEIQIKQPSHVNSKTLEIIGFPRPQFDPVA